MNNQIIDSFFKSNKRKVICGDEFLAKNMIIYIEKEIAENFSYNLIIDEFKNMKEVETILYMCDFFYRNIHTKLYFNIYHMEDANAGH